MTAALPLFSGVPEAPEARHDPGGKSKRRLPKGVVGRAEFSDCGRYRWLLERRRIELVGPARAAVLWVMLNPSTAGVNVDDATAAQCWAFTERWGYRRMLIVNLFAYRATKPTELLKVKNPTGDENFARIERLLAERPRGQGALLAMAAWGVIPARLNLQGAHMRSLFEAAGVPLHCLSTTADGSPGHPLYKSLNLLPEPWPA